MAPKTYYLLDSLASNSSHLALQDGGSPPSAATTPTGWTVGNQAAGEMSSMAAQTERARTTFTATSQPSGPPSGVLGDCFRTPARLRGKFTAGTWTLALPVIAVTSGGGQGGKARCRVWRSRFPDGALATEVTAVVQIGAPVALLTTLAQQISTITMVLPAIALAREHLFFQMAWEIVTAGGNINRDVLLRVGIDAAIVTPDFTPFDLAFPDWSAWTDIQLQDDLDEWNTDRNTLNASYLALGPANSQAKTDLEVTRAGYKREMIALVQEIRQRAGDI